jgi:DNA-binding MarR family transcriptional regulator
MELHNRQTRDDYQLSPSAREILAIIEGAGQPLEPSVIAERLLITTGSMTSLLDTLQKRGLIRRLPHPGDRRKLLVDITPHAQTIVDELLLSFHARERAVISSALNSAEQRPLLRPVAKIQQAAVQASPAPPIRDARRVRPDRTVNTGT